MTHYKYIAEFRYVPVAEMLDMRGKIAVAMLRGELEDWNITGNRVDVANKAKTKGVFVEHRHAGFAVEGEDAVDDLLQVVQEGMKIIPNLKYGRLGLRLTTIVGSNSTFSDLRKRIEAKLMKVDGVGKKPINSKLDDVGLSYVFSFDDGSKMNVTLGPMEEEQAKEYFNEHDTVPKVGIFLDLDCSLLNKPDTGLKEVKRFVHFAKQKVDSYRDHFLKVIEE